MLYTKVNKLFFAIPLFIFVWGMFGSNTAEAATLKLQPLNQTYTSGDMFDVTIMLDTEGAGVDGVDIHYLNYNPALLLVQGSITPGALFPNTNTSTVDSQNGKINFSQTSSGGVLFNGYGVVATVKFKALAVGTAPLTFDFTSGVTIDTNVSLGCSDVLSSVTNGSYTLQAQQNPPSRNPPNNGGGRGGDGGSSPQSVAISAIKTENIDAKTIKISWTANQPTKGEVKYGTTPQTLKDSALTTATNTTTHEAVLSNLTPQTTYYFQIIGTGSQNQKTTTAIQTFTTWKEAAPTLTLPDGTVIKPNTTVNAVDEAFPQATLVSIKQSHKDNQVRVTLAWVNPSDANITKVTLFRSNKRCSKGDVITSRDKTGADPITYEDTLPKEGEYFYSISPINKQGKESMRVVQWSSVSGNIVAYITKFAAQDKDCDGLSDNREELYESDPFHEDSDGDGFLDGVEAENGYPPTIHLGMRSLNMNLARRYRGRIIFVPHFHGEAYYIHPDTMKAYYLGRPYDALLVMARQGVGISNANLQRIPEAGTTSKGDPIFQKLVSGKIFLQMESHWEAWYVNPVDLKRYYLGRPDSALAVMQKLATGIANKDLITLDLQL